jgi:hypothetical protein
MRFPFATDEGRAPWWSRLFGVTTSNSWVEVDGDRLDVRFGPWRVSTGVDNVAHARITGPYSWWKVVGPARYSVSDRSLTFATSTDRGVELIFVKRVTGLDPWRVARHPSLTVTVADPDGLASALNARVRGGSAGR